MKIRSIIRPNHMPSHPDYIAREVDRVAKQINQKLRDAKFSESGVQITIVGEIPALSDNAVVVELEKQLADAGWAMEIMPISGSSASVEIKLRELK